jgi:hypothetical protein
MYQFLLDKALSLGRKVNMTKAESFMRVSLRSYKDNGKEGTPDISIRL